MKLLLYILVGMLLMGSLLSTHSLQAQSAPESFRPEEEILAPFLSIEQMTAFEVRIEQKWEDFLAYLNLLPQSADNQEMQALILQEVQALFVQSEVLMWTGDPLGRFLELQLNQDARKLESVPGSFGFFGFDLDRTTQTFRGFARVQLRSSEAETIEFLTIDVELASEVKQFGGNHRSVWVVKLGNVRAQ